MDKLLENRLVILIGMEHYTPLGVIRCLGENGINPVFIGVKYKACVASSSRYVKKSYLVNDDQEAFDLLLKEYGDVSEKTGLKPIVQFTDDSTVELFENHHDELKDKFIFFNAGGNHRIAKFLDKFEILQCAERHGVQILPTEVVKCGELPKHAEYPVITKAISPNAGAWKGDVNICYSEEELKAAFNRIKSPLALIQKFVEKKTEMTIEGYAVNKGKDMFAAIQCSYLYNIKGYYSPYHIDKPIQNQDLKEKLAAMIEEIGFEGVFDAGYPLAYLWCVSMLTGESPEPKDFEPFTSMVEPIDYSKRVEEGRCSLSEWLKDFKEAKCTYYYDPVDLKPWQVLTDNWDKLK